MVTWGSLIFNVSDIWFVIYNPHLGLGSLLRNANSYPLVIWSFFLFFSVIFRKMSLSISCILQTTISLCCSVDQFKWNSKNYLNKKSDLNQTNKKNKKNCQPCYMNGILGIKCKTLIWLRAEQRLRNHMVCALILMKKVEYDYRKHPHLDLVRIQGAKTFCRCDSG